MQISWIVFEGAKSQRECSNLTKKNRFSHPMGRMDFSCPQTVQNNICQKCRDTYYSFSKSSFQIWNIFDRFEVRVENLESSRWIFEQTLAVFFVVHWSQQDDAKIILQTTGLFEPVIVLNPWFILHQNTQFLDIAKIGRVVSDHERWIKK